MLNYFLSMVTNIFSYDLGIKQIFGQCSISENCFSTNEIVSVYERVKSCISCLLYTVAHSCHTIYLVYIKLKLLTSNYNCSHQIKIAHIKLQLFTSNYNCSHQITIHSHQITIRSHQITQQKMNNLFWPDENSNEQCFAAHIVQCCQQYCSVLLSLN